jgi:hypothetical protein
MRSAGETSQQLQIVESDMVPVSDEKGRRVESGPSVETGNEWRANLVTEQQQQQEQVSLGLDRAAEIMSNGHAESELDGWDVGEEQQGHLLD